MIQAAGRTDRGSPLAFFGLSGENITGLVAGTPIRIPATLMRDLGLPQVEIIIHYGVSESATLAEMATHGATVPY